jgi:hypothetical protein
LGAVTSVVITEAQKKAMDDAESGSSAGYGMPSDNSPRTIALNFPANLTADKIGLSSNDAQSITVEVSTDTTNGIDGNWTEVLSAGVTGTAYEYSEFAISPLSAPWLRINILTSTWNDNIRSLFIFGEYDAPRFEFWDEDGLIELTNNYPLLMANAPNFEDYHGAKGFRLKNTDSVAHTYSMVVAAVKYGGDAIISSNWTLSDDGGINKNGSLVLGALDAGEVSGVIGVYGDVLIADNPADGYHWFVVQVQETS